MDDCGTNIALVLALLTILVGMPVGVGLMVWLISKAR